MEVARSSDLGRAHCYRCALAFSQLCRYLRQCLLLREISCWREFVVTHKQNTTSRQMKMLLLLHSKFPGVTFDIDASVASNVNASIFGI